MNTPVPAVHRQRKMMMNKKRMIIQSVLSPPTVSLPVLKETCLRDFFDMTSTHGGVHNSLVSCRLCGCDQLLKKRANAKVSDTLRGMGLDVEKEDLRFCPFCLSKLQGLTRLKREVDRLGERLATMTLGLRTLFSIDSPAEDITEMEDGDGQLKVEVQDDEDALDLFECGEEFVTTDNKGNSDSVSSLPPDLHVPQTPVTVSKEEAQAVQTKGEEVKRCLCPTCGKTFDNERNLSQHLFRHNQKNLPEAERSYVYCKICPARFSAKCNHTKHMKRFHTEKMDAQAHLFCQVCRRSFTNPEAFESHNHPDKSDPTKVEYTCRLCGNTFDKAALFRCHITRVHAEEESCQCDSCGKVFKTAYRLKHHSKFCSGSGVRTKTRNVPRSCYFCQKVVAFLSEHLRTHTLERPFACKCGQDFTKPGNLRRHKSTVCGTKEEREYRNKRRNEYQRNCRAKAKQVVTT